MTDKENDKEKCEKCKGCKCRKKHDMYGRDHVHQSKKRYIRKRKVEIDDEKS